MRQWPTMAAKIIKRSRLKPKDVFCMRRNIDFHNVSAWPSLCMHRWRQCRQRTTRRKCAAAPASAIMTSTSVEKEMFCIARALGASSMLAAPSIAARWPISCEPPSALLSAAFRNRLPAIVPAKAKLIADYSGALASISTASAALVKISLTSSK